MTEKPFNFSDRRPLTTIMQTDQVTEEIIQAAVDIVEGWYNEGRVDWDNVWDRMDGQVLNDGSEIDMGTDIESPAMRKIKREVNKRRRG